MSKQLFFQTIQFSISKQFSYIRTIEKTISGATTTGKSGPGSDCSEGVLHIHQNSGITGASPSDFHINDSRWGSLTPLERRIRFILQSRLTGPILIVGVLLLCRDLVSEFYSPSRLGQFSLGKSYPSAEMQSVYSTTTANCANSRWESLTFLQTGPILVGGSLPLWWDAVVAFYSQQGQFSLEESYYSQEMLSLYSTPSADWTNPR